MLNSRSATARPTLVIARSDRLMARLKAMLIAWRFIDQVDGRLVMLWPKLPKRYAEENVGYSPANIFDLPKFYAEGGADRLCFVEQSMRQSEVDGISLEGAEFEGCLASGFDRSRFEGSSEIFLPRRKGRYLFSDELANPWVLLEQGRALFAQLPIHPRIAEARERFFEATGLEPGNYKAVHVRRGDVYTMLADALAPDNIDGLDEARLRLLLGHLIVRTAPFDFYRDWVADTIAQGRKIVFTSDTPGAISAFHSEFGAEHFIALDRFRMPLIIQKAFFDFLVLKDASHLVGTASNFSQFAAELGSKEFVNVAGTGPFESVAREFRDSILGERNFDSGREGQAVALLETLYAELVARNRRVKWQG